MSLGLNGSVHIQRPGMPVTDYKVLKPILRDLQDYGFIERSNDLDNIGELDITFADVGYKQILEIREIFDKNGIIYDWLHPKSLRIFYSHI